MTKEDFMIVNFNFHELRSEHGFITTLCFNFDWKLAKK